jgi:pimeloyl-ACP methyl ester carboxylesterase
MKWIRRAGLMLAGIIALALLLGFVYEGLGRSRAAKEFPAIGKLVDIGGRRIQLDCRGSGTPTVVFESGLDMSGSLAWLGVHDSIAAGTRACAYSRAGIMWSDSHTGPQTGKLVAEDLHKVLAAAGERPPFILVAHSIGGPYAMIYTKSYGRDVAGLVLVDASHPDQVERLKSLTPVTLQGSLRMYRVASSLRRFGIVRKLAAADSAPPQPTHSVKASAAYASISLPAMLKEADGFDQTMTEAGTFRQLGDRPLIVLTAAAPIPTTDLTAMKMTEAQGHQYQALWLEMQKDEASWSTRGRQQSVQSGHYIQFEQPATVIAAVRSVIDAVRNDNGSH